MCRLYKIDGSALPFQEEHSSRWSKCPNCLLSLCCQESPSGQFCSLDCKFSYSLKKEVGEETFVEDSATPNETPENARGIARIKTEREFVPFSAYASSLRRQASEYSYAGIEF